MKEAKGLTDRRDLPTHFVQRAQRRHTNVSYPLTRSHLITLNALFVYTNPIDKIGRDAMMQCDRKNYIQEVLERNYDAYFLSNASIYKDSLEMTINNNYATESHIRVHNFHQYTFRIWFVTCKYHEQAPSSSLYLLTYKKGPYRTYSHVYDLSSYQMKYLAAIAH